MEKSRAYALIRYHALFLVDDRLNTFLHTRSPSDLTYEVLCGRCGYRIHSCYDLRSPVEILKLFGNRCMKCHARLSLGSFEVEVGRVGFALDHIDHVELSRTYVSARVPRNEG